MFLVQVQLNPQRIWIFKGDSGHYKSLIQVWAVDVKDNLYTRSGISERCPEGHSWICVCQNVKQVSVGPVDQVWAIIDNVPSKNGQIKGVVARRVGIPPDNPKEGSWDCGPGGGFHHICTRAWLK